MKLIQRFGLRTNHEYYTIDVSGYSERDKKLIRDNLQTLHEYSWLDGAHYLSVRGNPYEIDKIMGKLVEATLKDETIIPFFPPIFQSADPDKEFTYRTSLRERFYLQYDQTN